MTRKQKRLVVIGDDIDVLKEAFVVGNRALPLLEEGLRFIAPSLRSREQGGFRRMRVFERVAYSSPLSAGASIVGICAGPWRLGSPRRHIHGSFIRRRHAGGFAPKEEPAGGGEGDEHEDQGELAHGWIPSGVLGLRAIGEPGRRDYK